MNEIYFSFICHNSYDAKVGVHQLNVICKLTAELLEADTLLPQDKHNVQPFLYMLSKQLGSLENTVFRTPYNQYQAISTYNDAPHNLNQGFIVEKRLEGRDSIAYARVSNKTNVPCMALSRIFTRNE